MPDNDDTNVVQAFPASTELPENLMTIAPAPPGMVPYCQHDAIRLDTYDRTVQCARCGTTLDPFNFLLNNALTMKHAWDNYRATKGQVSTLTDRVMFLKKEEKRLAAKVRRLQTKTGEVILSRQP